MKLPRLMVDGEYAHRITPISLSVANSLQPLSTANMTLTHDEAIHCGDWMQIFTPDGGAGYYRVGTVNIDSITGNQNVYLEQGACTLGDELIVDDVTMTDTVSNIISFILGKQDVERWAVGTVEATDTIYVDLGGFSLMDCLTTMMQYIPDYYLEFEQPNATDWRVNVRRRSTTVLCEARLSRNLKTCSIGYSVASIVTRVYAEGLPDGHLDSANVAVYGLHEETQSFGDGLSAAQKLAVATAYLNNHDHPTVSVSISGVELSQVTGLDIDSFQIGAVCRVVIPWLGITVDDVIIDKSYSDCFGNPQSVSVTLANAVPDLAIAMAAITGGGGGGGGGMAGGMKQAEKERKRFETHFEQTDEYFRLLATDTQWDEMGAGTLTAYSQIVQNSSSIQGVVSDIASSGYASITLLADSVRTKVGTGEVATELAVECGNVSITGGNLIVDGYVTATAFDGLTANFNNLVSGQAEATTLATAVLNGKIINATQGFTYKGSTVSQRTIKMSTLASASVLCVSALTSDVDFDHAHGFSISGGVVTMGGAVALNDSSRSFNIADTAFYQSGVSAAHDQGWDDAAAATTIPKTEPSSIGSTMTVVYPVTGGTTTNQLYSLNNGYWNTAYTNPRRFITLRAGGTSGTIVAQTYIDMPGSPSSFSVTVDGPSGAHGTYSASCTVNGKRYSKSGSWSS